MREYIFDLGFDRFAVGERGKPARRTTERYYTYGDYSTRTGRPLYVGIRGRRPRIPLDAKVVPRDRASDSMKRALGLL